MNSSYDNMKG